jgi:serine/threonine-protein kinase RsbW
MRAWLRDALATYPASDGETAALLTAAGELCTNSIKHAYEGRGGEPIELRLDAFADRVVLEIEDFGRAFDAARYVPPDLESRPNHGMGLFIVRSLMDSLEVDVARPRGTRWTVTKYVGRRGSAASGQKSP